MRISPISPGGRTQRGSSRLATSISIPGSGTPIAPGPKSKLGGIAVPAGQVSVMPQPPPSGKPVSARQRCATSNGSEAPPEPEMRRLERSRVSIPGWFTSAIHIVGTPGK